MATYKQMANLARKRWKHLEQKIGGAVKSIAAWKDEVKQLGGLVSSLEGMGGGKSPRGPRKGKRGKKRGTWKPGSRGRKPQWYLDKLKGKGNELTKKVQKAKKAVSKKVLAGLANAREALAAKREKAAQKQ